MSRYFTLPGGNIVLDEIELEPLDFCVEDEIIFECSSLTKNRPRWQFNDDTGGNDVWAKGKVTYVDAEIIQVEYTIDGFIGLGNCTWPNINHDDYDPSQWWQQGYLQILEKKINKCECGAEATYGFNATHSSWCPKFK